MGDVTREDLRDLRDSIVGEMRLGFTGIHSRQDTTNGRVNHAEQNLARMDQRMKNVEREMFPRRAQVAQATDAALGMSKGKLAAVVTAGLAGLAGLSEVAHALAEAVRAGVQALAR